MTEKERTYWIYPTYLGGPSLVTGEPDLLDALRESEDGEEFSVTVKDMTKEEIAALPEFIGW